jgi:hypothetical protein
MLGASASICWFDVAAYRRRILDDTLDLLFPQLAAVALEGAKGVGKTATATQRASASLSLHNPNERAALAGNLDLITQLPRFLNNVSAWRRFARREPAWSRIAAMRRCCFKLAHAGTGTPAIHGRR